MLHNRSPMDITIYVLLLTSMFLMIFSGLSYYLTKYKKEKKQVFTIKKIVIFSLFFGTFIIQSLFTRFVGSAPIIPFSLDTITIIAVGFIFGPVEGIVYGITADLTRVFINGWTPMLLPSLSFALLGLFSGMLGRLYFKKGNEMNDIWAFFGMQAIIVFFCLFNSNFLTE